MPTGNFESSIKCSPILLSITLTTHDVKHFSHEYTHGTCVCVLPYTTMLSKSRGKSHLCLIADFSEKTSNITSKYGINYTFFALIIKRQINLAFFG